MRLPLLAKVTRSVDHLTSHACSMPTRTITTPNMTLMVVSEAIGKVKGRFLCQAFMGQSVRSLDGKDDSPKIVTQFMCESTSLINLQPQEPNVFGALGWKRLLSRSSELDFRG